MLITQQCQDLFSCEVPYCIYTLKLFSSMQYNDSIFSMTRNLVSRKKQDILGIRHWYCANMVTFDDCYQLDHIQPNVVFHHMRIAALSTSSSSRESQTNQVNIP